MDAAGASQSVFPIFPWSCCSAAMQSRGWIFIVNILEKHVTTCIDALYCGTYKSKKFIRYRRFYSRLLWYLHILGIFSTISWKNLLWFIQKLTRLNPAKLPVSVWIYGFNFHKPLKTTIICIVWLKQSQLYFK